MCYLREQAENSSQRAAAQVLLGRDDHQGSAFGCAESSSLGVKLHVDSLSLCCFNNSLHLNAS